MVSPDLTRAIRIKRNIVDRMTATINIRGNTVELIIDLSEYERSLIYKSHLDSIVLEDRPEFTSQEIAKFRLEYDQKKNAETDPYVKELYGSFDEHIHLYQKRIKTSLGDLLVAPYLRICQNPHEAVEFVAKLKKEILPKIKSLIDQHGTTPQSETIQF